MGTKHKGASEITMVRALCNSWPSFHMGFIFECLQMFDFSAKQPSRPSTGWPLHQNVGDDISFMSWHLNMTLYLVITHWAPDCLWHGSWQNGLWTPALYFTPSTLVICASDREHSCSMLSRPRKQPLSKSCLGHLYKHRAPSRELCIFKTFASSSQPASLTFSGPINATTTSLIPKVQAHGFDFLFSAHLLCAGAIICQ